MVIFMEAPDLYDKFSTLGVATLVFVFLALSAWRRRYFEMPNDHFRPPPSLRISDVLGIFALFLFVEVIVVPALAYIYGAIMQGELTGKIQLNLTKIQQGWLNLVAILAAAFAVIAYTFAMAPPLRKLIYWGTAFPESMQRGIKAFTIGVATWFISYPAVVMVSQLVGIALYFFGPLKHVEQTAVQHLKSTMESTPLFWATTFLIIFIVPIAEETLFRGFLQRWLVQKLGRWWGIGIAAALFSAFHFSTTQGIDNIELLLSLFTLACFLGFIYERQGTLWAPISLHSVFNAISVLMIVGQEWSQHYAPS